MFSICPISVYFIIFSVFFFPILQADGAEKISIGEIKNIIGEVFIKDGDEWKQLEDNLQITSNTLLKTEEGLVSIEFIDNSKIDISKDSVIFIRGAARLDYALGIEQGAFAFNIDPDASLAVNTPSADISFGYKRGVVQLLAFGEVKRLMGVVSTDRRTTEIKSVAGRIPVTIGEFDFKIIAPHENITILADGSYKVSMTLSRNFFVGSDGAYQGYISDSFAAPPEDMLFACSLILNKKDDEVLQSAIDAKTANVGRVYSIDGKAGITRLDEQIDINVYDRVFLEDIIESDDDTSIQISFIDDSLLTVGENSIFAVREFLVGAKGARGESVFSLIGGKTRAIVGGNKLKIITPTGIINASGTIIIIEVINGETRLYVIENEATFDYIGSDGETVVVLEGYMYGDGMTEPEPLPPKKMLDDTISPYEVTCNLCERLVDDVCVIDDSMDPGTCLKCVGGSAAPDDTEDPGMCLKCDGGVAVPDNTEDPGICYSCIEGITVIDNSEPCSDDDPCTENDRCFEGVCVGDQITSIVDPEC